MASKNPRDVRTKRVYLEPSASDGRRFLVDRIWPRGISKDRAGVEAWLPSVAPTADLRRWFGHDPAKWELFVERYHAELDSNPEGLTLLLEAARTGRLTLVYSARDEERNQAVALAAYLGTR